MPQKLLRNKKKAPSLWGSIDWLTIFIYLVLLALGWMSVCGACYEFGGTGSIFEFSTRSGMQIVWIGTSLLLAFIILMTDDRIIEFTKAIVISNLANAKELAYDEILFLLGTDGSYAFELVNQEGSLGVVPFEKALYDDCAVKFGATIPALRDDPAVVVDLAYVLQKVSAEAQKTGVNVN